MWYGWNTHPVTDSETFLSKGWLSRSVLGACVCVHLCGSRHHPVPLTPTRYPLLLSLALSSPLPLQYLISPCAGTGNTHTFCFSACWLSSSILLCLLCVLLPLQPMSPPHPWGLLASLVTWLFLLLLKEWSGLTQRCYPGAALPRYSSMPFASHSALLDNYHCVCQRQRQRTGEEGGKETERLHSLFNCCILQSFLSSASPGCRRAVQGTTWCEKAP